MRIYLDNCCFNRPFDDQSQLRVRLETEAKLRIQEGLLEGTWQLVWSYVLDYENSHNPFPEPREQISAWKGHAVADPGEETAIVEFAREITRRGVKDTDALHIACAVHAGAAHFLTTDDIILKNSSRFQEINVVDPIEFIREMML